MELKKKHQIGVLLVNLGTPNSPAPRDVYHYLNEFLTDGRVIDYPWLKRQLLVRAGIVPLRFRQSAKLYKKIWTDQGSPLLVYGQALRSTLEQALGEHYRIALAMRYQNPSIQKGLKELQDAKVRSIIVLPLFPQYASATTGSVHQKVMEEVQKWFAIPKMTFLNSFHDDPFFIQALVERGKQYPLEAYDHILFSFHGLPERQVQKNNSPFCYKMQCEQTASLIAGHLNLSTEQYSVCYQSRLGKEPWIQPYTSDIIHQCAKKGYRKLLVFSPSFVCDCLETICEISYEYQEEFKNLGGESLQLVEGLNTHPAFVKSLQQIIIKNS